MTRSKYLITAVLLQVITGSQAAPQATPFIVMYKLQRSVLLA
ncbi:hypothetical protein HYQ46_013412 [Verticillium longisporum]|nr:hypothetical protein HYQ46_013412 [Verticillium longisporum]